MHWTRRHFIGFCSAVAGALSVGGVSLATRELKGRAYFDDWRALPGMIMTLHLDVESPENTEVTLIARHDGIETTLDTIDGARELDIRMPYIPTKGESYDLCAVVTDRMGRCCRAERVEVLSQPYRFGM